MSHNSETHNSETHCPDDATLQRFIVDVLTPDDSFEIELHLDECERCRLRLDVLGRVTSIGAVLVEAAATPRSDSPSLQLRMAQLQHELTSFDESMARVRTDGALTATLPLLQPSEREGSIGRIGYLEVRRVIGRGGMGVVYEGYDAALDRLVAVKVLSPHLLGDDAARERFRREAQAAATLNDEHIVTIHAINEIDGMPYLVLQHVAGESLAERLSRQTRLPMDEVAAIGVQVARGLAAAHARGIIHRDIKPANLLLERESGTVRIADFGLAKSMGRDSITNVGTVAGTPAYMSPEQAHGDAVDARSDLFSLGVVLYTLATGWLPFDGESPYVIMNRIRETPPKSLATLDPTLPAWFCEIVSRLLEKEPARRIQSAAEVADLLERGEAPAPNRTRSRHARTVAVAAVLVCAVVAVTTYLAWPHRDIASITPPLPTTALSQLQVTIQGRAVGYPSLAEAVQAATDGDTIELSGDGPFLSPRIDIRGKRLVIRAANGSRPVFQPDGSSPALPWLQSDSELTLTGLEADWPLTSKVNIGTDEPTDAVVLCRANLTLERCRIISGNRMPCIASEGRLLVTDCHLISHRANGRAIAWRANGLMRVTNTVIESRFGIGISAPFQPTENNVELSNCLFRTDTTFIIVRPITFPAPVQFNVNRTVFDCDKVMSLLFDIPPGLRRATSAELKTMLAKVVKWGESENAYRRRAIYLSGLMVQRPINPSDIRSLADWNGFWTQTATGSIEGDLLFPAQVPGDKSIPHLDTIEDPSGPVPQSLGPTIPSKLAPR